MKRYILLAGAAVVAVILIWHPASRPAGLTPLAEPAAQHRRTVQGSADGSVDRVSGVVVYVAGAVRRPGLYHVRPDARVDDAVRMAGGLLPVADPVALNLAARLNDGEEVAVLARGEQSARSRVRSSTVRTRKTHRSASPAPASVDPNLADMASLARVPGIGPAIAERILSVRENEGPFRSLDELLDVGGMTPARLDRAAPYLEIEH